jgi:hypothetical protein
VTPLFSKPKTCRVRVRAAVRTCVLAVRTRGADETNDVLQ